MLLQQQQISTATELLIYDDDGNVEEEFPVDFAAYQEAAGIEEPDPADFGVWVPGIPALIGERAGCG